VSSLAAKIIYPFGVVLTTFMIQLLRPVMGGFLASVFSVTTVWLLPDAFGFLFWEMKENWTLYRANRRATLQPVLVGPHGETLRRLIYPGFHSGTVPKLYARLRQAEREAGNTGSWRAARLCRNSLEQVERSVRRFVGRELITLLKQSSSWQRQRVKVGQVSLATNRIRVELVHEAYPANSAWLEFEEDAGWLVAGIRQPGWLDQLTPGQQHAVITGLAGLYKLAGVQLVREQIQANLPPKVCCYDITARGLTVWLDHRQGQAIFYNLNGPDGELKPRTREGAPTTAGPVLEASRLIFERVPLSWQRWVENWQQEQEGHTALELFTPEVKLLPAAQPV